MMRRLRIAAWLGLVTVVSLLLSSIAQGGATTTRASLKSDVCYQIMTDRFFDGNTANNDPSVSAGLYDSTKSNWKLYWGGDFAGIQQKSTYLKDMGVTSVWISPPVDNVNKSVTYDGVKHAGYHGYWARDFKVPEEHFGTWTEFDNMVNSLHSNGIKVIVDLAPNHTSPADPNDSTRGEQGALYDNGTYMGNLLDDTGRGYFHHNGGISDWNDRFQTQYHSLFDLADFSQEHATIDGYLRDMTKLWLNRNTDGIRVDAIKHMPWGWQKSYADTVYNHKDVVMFGEWYSDTFSDPLYGDLVQYANRTGIGALDFVLNKKIREVFAGSGSMWDLWNTLNQLNSDFTYRDNLITFIDNHDMPRFLTVMNNKNRMHEALAFILTNRGTPCIYYGTEQYLHNDTNGGGDPYNRPMMSSWSTTTTAYNLIKKLSTLRQSNPAIQFGTTQQRWVNDDVFIYERKFFNDVVLVAINKSTTSSYGISGLYTQLPAGTYSDYLGLQNGNSITVNSGTGDRSVKNFTLKANAISVWQYKANEPSTPQLGAVSPVIGRAGNTVTIEGRGFGTSTGQVLFDSTAASIISWSPNVIKAQVPSTAAGMRKVSVKVGGSQSNQHDFEMLTAKQIPVTFTVTNATPTNIGDYIYLTGSIHELGNWSTSKNFAIGPMLCPNYPDWFLTVSVPAGTYMEFKFIKIAEDGTVTWEAGANHTYTSPTSGTGSVTVGWQY